MPFITLMTNMTMTEVNLVFVNKFIRDLAGFLGKHQKTMIWDLKTDVDMGQMGERYQRKLSVTIEGFDCFDTDCEVDRIKSSILRCLKHEFSETEFNLKLAVIEPERIGFMGVPCKSLK